MEFSYKPYIENPKTITFNSIDDVVNYLKNVALPDFKINAQAFKVDYENGESYCMQVATVVDVTKEIEPIAKELNITNKELVSTFNSFMNVAETRPSNVSELKKSLVDMLQNQNYTRTNAIGYELGKQEPQRGLL